MIKNKKTKNPRIAFFVFKLYSSEIKMYLFQDIHLQ